MEQVFAGNARMTVISKLTAETSYSVRVSALNNWGQVCVCVCVCVCMTPPYSVRVYLLKR